MFQNTGGQAIDQTSANLSTSHKGSKNVQFNTSEKQNNNNNNNGGIQRHLTQHFQQQIGNKIIKVQNLDVENKEAMHQIKYKRRPTVNNANYDEFIDTLNQEVIDRFKKQKTQHQNGRELQFQSSKQNSMLGINMQVSPIDSPKKRKLSHRQDDAINDNKSYIMAQLKEKLEHKTKILSTSIGQVYAKGPSFEYPIINYSPTTPSRMHNLLELDKAQNKKQNQTVIESPSKWKLLSDVITNKYNQKFPIKDMIESSYMKDNVFNKIYSKMSLGKKLKRYDIYMNEEVGRKELKQLKQVVFEKGDLNSSMNKNTKKYKQMQIQQQLATLTKKAAQQEQEEKEATQSYMQTKQSKNHQFLAIKQAVDNKEITLDEANEIILQHSKQTNEQLFKSVKDSKQSFDTVFNQFKMKHYMKSSIREGSNGVSLNKSHDDTNFKNKKSRSPINSQSRLSVSQNQKRRLRPQSAMYLSAQMKRQKSPDKLNSQERKVSRFHEPKPYNQLKRQSQSHSMIELTNNNNDNHHRSRSPSMNNSKSQLQSQQQQQKYHHNYNLSSQIVNLNFTNQDIENVNTIQNESLKTIKNTMTVSSNNIKQETKSKKQSRPHSSQASVSAKVKQKLTKRLNNYNKVLSMSFDKKPNTHNSNRKYIYKDWRQYLYSNGSNRHDNIQIMHRSNNQTSTSMNSHQQSSNKLRQNNPQIQQQQQIFEKVDKSQMLQKLFYYPQDSMMSNGGGGGNNRQQNLTEMKYYSQNQSKQALQFINSDFDRLQVNSNIINLQLNSNNNNSIQNHRSRPTSNSHMSHYQIQSHNNAKKQQQFQINLTTTNQTQFDTNQSQSIFNFNDISNHNNSNYNNLKSDSINNYNYNNNIMNSGIQNNDKFDISP